MPNPNINRRTIGTPFQLSVLNSEWVSRVLGAGGVFPSENTLRGNDLFYKMITDGGIVSKVKSANLFPFELNVPTFSTPLIATVGLGTWTTLSGPWLTSDMTINGLNGNATKVFDTGIVPSSVAGVSSSHGCVYVSEGDKTTAQTEYGRATTGSDGYRLYYQYTDNNTYLNAQGSNINAIISSGVLAGYVCSSRTTSTRIDCFYATSTTAHASAFNSTALNTAAGSASGTIYLFATREVDTATNKSKKRISYAGWGEGLSLAESAVLFNAVDTVRRYWGGGFV